MKLNNLCKILRYILIFGIFLTIMILICLPFIIEHLNYEFNLLFILLYPCGACFIYLIKEFYGMFLMLEENKPFCNKVINHFNYSMICVFIISLLILMMVLLAIFKYHYNLSFILCISFMSVLFFGVGIALYMLKELFKQAIAYKEEVDLTI